MTDADPVLRDLLAVIAASFPDRDVPADAGPDTRLFADLGLASIDVIVLGERLEAFYARPLPFGPFLASLRDRGAEDLELGELAAFLRGQV